MALVTVDVETSTNLGSIPLGFQEIPIDRLSTVRWRQGSKYRVILTTVGVLGGLVAGLWIGMPEDSLHWGGGNIVPLMIFPALGGNLRAFFGKAVGPETDHFRVPTTGDGRSAQIIRDWKASAFLKPLGRIEIRSGASTLLLGGADQRRAGRTTRATRRPPGPSRTEIRYEHCTLLHSIPSP